ncbi:hypothetical protein [Salinicola halimionae]|uniref:hypothetical protein n=1 Tax=Salinicola halimionae TaxID=1949081 RepID=UPI000DA1360D|nr:hypothetical protein [Salinicola halimionae]
MKTVKVMSLIGIVFFSLCLLFLLVCMESDVEAAAGWGMFATLYGIGFAITAFVQANNRVKAGVE